MGQEMEKTLRKAPITSDSKLHQYSPEFPKAECGPKGRAKCPYRSSQGPTGDSSSEMCGWLDGHWTPWAHRAARRSMQMPLMQEAVCRGGGGERDWQLHHTFLRCVRTHTLTCMLYTCSCIPHIHTLIHTLIDAHAHPTCSHTLMLSQEQTLHHKEPHPGLGRAPTSPVPVHLSSARTSSTGTHQTPTAHAG